MRAFLAGSLSRNPARVLENDSDSDSEAEVHARPVSVRIAPAVRMTSQRL